MKRALVVVALLLACNDKPVTERPADEKVALGGEVAARVGGTPIPLSLVAAVASAQKLSAQDAARRVIDDAIVAQAAHDQGLDERRPAAWNLIAARARITADRIHADAVNKGPPTDNEVRMLSARHWTEVDRPPTMKVVQALVFHAKDPKNEPAARALAIQIHDAVIGATSQADFESRAKAINHDKALDVRIEVDATFTADGRVVEGGQFNATFSAAAGKLAPGATTDVVETSFGYHVIRLLERYPALQMPLEDRRAAFAEEAYAFRSQRAVGAAMQELQAKTKVEISPAAESLMRAVALSKMAEPQALLP